MRVPSLLIFHVGRIFYGAASELLTKSLCLPTVFTPAATPAKWVAGIDACPRSFVAATPEGSEFTSIYQRIREIRAEPTPSTEPDAAPQIPLMSFQSGPTHVPVLPYRFQDYLSLVDWTGRASRDDKRGVNDGRLPPIIQRMNIDSDAWQLAMQPRGNVFGRAMGRLDHLRLHAKTLGQSWIKGVRAAEALYN